MPENEKIIVVQKTASQHFRTKSIWQYDVGHALRFDGFNLPYTFEVHFAHSPNGESQKQIGQDGVCEVPAEYTQNSGFAYAWLYEVTEDTGLTKHQIEIPVEGRARPTDQEPSPAQQSVIDQTIAASNNALEKTLEAQQAAKDAANSVKNAGATAETLAPGSPATVVVRDVNGVKTFEFGIPEGQKGETGETPNFTVGSVTTLPAGSPVTVTITGTPENPVLNIGIPQGAQGVKGDTGAVPHFAIGTVTTLHPDSPATVTITGTDENPILNLGIPKGVQGQKGDKGDAFTYADFTEEQKTELIQGPIKTAQDEAVEAVDDEGQRVLDSIPSDYSELAEDVSSLKNDKQDKPQTAGTACQVLGLDENLDPVWMDQSGGAVDDSALAPVIKATASGEIASFADGAENRKIDSLVVNIEPVQSGSGDPAPNNERPISGWTGANIQRAGKNLFPSSARWYNARRYSQDQSTPSVVQIENDTEVVFPASVNAVQAGWCKAVPCKAGQTYTLKYYGEKSYRMNIAEYADLTDAHDYTKAVSAVSSTVNNTVTYTAVNDGLILCAVLGYSSSNLATLDGTEESQLELGSEATDYKPYNGTSVSVDWTDEAGTVYGAKLDVISGVLTVYNTERTLTGNETWYAYTSFEGFNWRDSGMKPGNRHNGICNWLPTASDSDLGVPSAWFGAGATNAYIYAVHVWDLIGITGSESTADMVTAWKAYLAEHPLQVVYPLAEPIVYHLTPHEVLTLLGQNNIFADCGSIESVEYSADTKLYSDSHAAPVKDVQVNGTSVLSNGVANVPLASNSTVGVAKFRTDFGLQFNNSMQSAAIFPATDGNIKAGTNAYRPIVANSQHLATFYGLAKAAGDTTQSASANAVGSYTDEAKAKIARMLGIPVKQNIILTENDYDADLGMFVFDAGEGNEVEKIFVAGQIVYDEGVSGGNLAVGFGNTVNRSSYNEFVTATPSSSCKRLVFVAVGENTKFPYANSNYRIITGFGFYGFSSNNTTHSVNVDAVLNVAMTGKGTNFYPNFNDPRYVHILAPATPDWAYISIEYTLR